MKQDDDDEFNKLLEESLGHYGRTSVIGPLDLVSFANRCNDGKP